jgi:hypothetical protein
LVGSSLAGGGGGLCRDGGVGVQCTLAITTIALLCFCLDLLVVLACVLLCLCFCLSGLGIAWLEVQTAERRLSGKHVLLSGRGGDGEWMWACGLLASSSVCSAPGRVPVCHCQNISSCKYTS